MTPRLALCNEVLAPWPWQRQCEYATALGYHGLEVAPYTLAADPLQITEAQAHQWAAMASDHGLQISGLHWLLVAPQGLSISHPDAAVRARTLQAIERLIELCAWLGGAYLVHGSPAQRNPQPGQSVNDALALATEAWVAAGERAARFDVTYCIEPLARDQTTVVNTIEQALAIVRAAGLPRLKTMLDTSSAGATEVEPLPALIDRWWPSANLAHVQLNDRNRRGPGQGDDRFAPILAALARNHYAGWLAMEPFEYVPDGPSCAAHSIGYVRALLEAAADGSGRGACFPG
ncbi:MAG: sugar phosphate isomerase/epimerase [Burkholderiaceae bacterium]|nr:sugar phosphate isomerase/epimerase [Burkholderiaceae bacterium]